MPWGYTKAEGKFPSPAGPLVAEIPEPEHVQGRNFAYRGYETHGVAVPPSVHETEYPDAWDEQDVEEVLAPEKEIEATPVRIVQYGSREMQDWRSGQTVVSTVALLVSRNERRKLVRIRNLSATIALYIGNTLGTSTISGYPIPANSELTINTTEEVYGVSGDGNVLSVAIIQEITVET